MQWWKSIVLGVPMSMMLTGVAQAETFVMTLWKPMSLSFSLCIKEAKAVLETGQFKEKPGNTSLLEDGSGSAWAGTDHGRQYKAIIQCLPDQELVFFAVAGPDLKTTDKYARTLKKNFTSNSN